jgi:tRNA modification GTPase
VSLRRTIAAIATAPGAAALGVIRVSGPDAFAIVRQLWHGLGDAPASHRARLATLRWEAEPLDQALVLPFVGPSSFTGEDVVELHCHGGPMILDRVLSALLQAGASLAEAGEFSRQALQNGKLDLVQIEAIADLIAAESESARKLALDHLAGRLTEEIDAAKDALRDTTALVEAAIDFSLEEHVYSLSSEEIVAQLTPILARVDALLATYDEGRLRTDGVRVAIVGPPNAGKSSLLNALLGANRALVTEVAGTTRDYLEASWTHDGVRYQLVDTAGLRSTLDPVEALGVGRAREQARAADAVLVVAPVDDVAAASAVVEEVRSEYSGPIGLLWNKVDLHDAPAILAEITRRHSVSILRGDGLSELPALLRGLAEDAGLVRGRSSVLITRARHRSHLLAARSSLSCALEAAESGLGHELVAVDIREALVSLGALTGAVTTDAVLAQIFSDFCIGK